MQASPARGSRPIRPVVAPSSSSWPPSLTACVPAAVPSRAATRAVAGALSESTRSSVGGGWPRAADAGTPTVPVLTARMRAVPNATTTTIGARRDRGGAGSGVPDAEVGPVATPYQPFVQEGELVMERCAICGRPIRWAWPIARYMHENPNVTNHRPRLVPPPPTPSRPCGCPDYAAATPSVPVTSRKVGEG